MIISEIMKYLWKDERIRFYKMLEDVRCLSDRELFELASQNKMTSYSYPATKMNLLPCPICSYRLTNDFAGCSMCDYENEDIIHKAILTALCEKNRSLYSKAIAQSFYNTRGIKPDPEVFELISSYDSFSDNEFPEELFRELFVENKLFSKRPFCYILEARASSISKEKLKLLQECFAKESRLIIEFGVEVSSEWIRNHWLNKSVTNSQIINAIDLIHKMGYKASADVLIGIPGFTEEQSIKCFCDTVLWLDELGIDNIIALPLNRKRKTLQGAMYTYLRDDPVLNKNGLMQKEHTGIPWLITIVRALYEIIHLKKNIGKKIRLSQIYPYQNSVENVTAYNNKNCECNEKLTSALSLYQKKRDESIIFDAVNYLMSNRHKCSQDYDDLLKKQSNMTIECTTNMIVNSFIMCFWPDAFEIKRKGFIKELDLLKGNFL